MKKRRNLLKTLTLCCIAALSTGYAVISNQTLTYTETIPVGEKKLDVVFNDNDATDNGTKINITWDRTLIETLETSPTVESYLYLDVSNRETDLTVHLAPTITVYGDDTDLSLEGYFTNFGFLVVEENDYTYNLAPGANETFHIHYDLTGVVNELLKYETIRIEVTLTATAVNS